MSSMSETVIIEVIKSLDSKITNLATDVGKVNTELSLIKQTLTEVKEQTMKTNGRVTKLEDITVKLNEHSITLTALVSKQEGLYTQGLEALETRLKTVENKDRDINEFNKKNTDITKINVENSWKLKLAIWGTISILLTSGLTWFLTNTIDRHEEQIITQTK